MRARTLRSTPLYALVCVLCPALSAPAAQPDFDNTGYIDLADYVFFEICFSNSGPNSTPPFNECVTAFDIETDSDIDLEDFAAFQRQQGHTPILLKSALGQAIGIDSTEPYSPRQTCGMCHQHEADIVGNGEWFQQGRADVSWFPSEGAGPFIRPYEVFGLDHNVLAKENAWGSGELPDNMCTHCHTTVGTSPVIDRAVLLDPFDETGEPVYSTVRELYGINPP